MNDSSIFFVTPDIWRGIGLEDHLPNFSIICSSYDPIIPILRRQGTNIFCLEEESGKNTLPAVNSAKLLEHTSVTSFIRSKTRGTPAILFFKPSLKLDTVIKNFGYIPIGNSSSINEEFENKLVFYNHVKDVFAGDLPKTVIGQLGHMDFQEVRSQLDLPFVIQFGHGWAGNTTFIIKNKESFRALSNKFPVTQVKVSQYINGYTILNNCCIYKDHIFVSPPALQIQGIEELSPNPFATCGRQWPVSNIQDDGKNTIQVMSQTVGTILQKKEYKGIFGIDFIVEKKTGKIFLTEVNARLTASIPFFTKLEIGQGKNPLLLYHVASFLPFGTLSMYSSDDLSGSQLIIRKKETVKKMSFSREYGVYTIGNKKPKRDGYHPESLRNDEYIFIQKNMEARHSEYARLESKRNVIDGCDRLESWVTALWGGSI